MHHSSSQEFQLATLGSKFEKQQERNHGEQLASSETYSISITCDASNRVKSQALNQKASQQHPVQPQHSTTQKPRPANTTPTTKPADQYITMSSRKQQSTSPSLRQTTEISDYHSRAPSSQCQVARVTDTVTSDAQFHYVYMHGVRYNILLLTLTQYQLILKHQH